MRPRGRLNGGHAGKLCPQVQRGSQQGRGDGAPLQAGLRLLSLSPAPPSMRRETPVRSSGLLEVCQRTQEQRRPGLPPRFSAGLLSNQGAKPEGPGSPSLALRALPTPPGKRLIQSKAKHLTPALTLDKAQSHYSLGSPLARLSCPPFLTHRTSPRQQCLQRETTCSTGGRRREPLRLHPAQRTWNTGRALGTQLSFQAVKQRRPQSLPTLAQYWTIPSPRSSRGP